MSNNGSENVDEEDMEAIICYGREYSKVAIQNEIYLCPGDEKEAERLDHLHNTLKQEFQSPIIPDPLLLVPYNENRANKILDCGCGTAAWAIDVARQHQNWNIIGLDIWPFMAVEEELRSVPNLELELADLNDPFTFESNSFDIVNSRFVADGIAASRWPSYLKDIHRVLKRGGWVQMFEMYFNIQSDSGRLEGSALRQWSQEYMHSLTLSDNHRGRKEPRIHNRMNDFIRQSGLVLESCTKRDLPLSEWSTDEHKRNVGKLMRQNMRELLRSNSLYPFKYRLSKRDIEFEALMGAANRELDDLANKPYLSLYIWRAQKP